MVLGGTLQELTPKPMIFPAPNFSPLRSRGARTKNRRFMALRRQTTPCHPESPTAERTYICYVCFKIKGCDGSYTSTLISLLLPVEDIFGSRKKDPETYTKPEGESEILINPANQNTRYFAQTCRAARY